MNFTDIQEQEVEVKTQEQARDYAIEWQHWANEQDLSYVELAAWQEVFTKLGEQYGLSEEYKENGII